MFLGKSVLKYGANLQENNHVEARFHTSDGCSPVNLPHIFRRSFPKNTTGELLRKTVVHVNKIHRYLQRCIYDPGKKC